MRNSMIEQLLPLQESWWDIAAKTIGAVSGSAVSIVYMLPENCREAAARFLVGVVFGLVFARPVGLKMSGLMGIRGELSTLELSLAGAAMASLIAWWGLGALARFLRSYQPK